MRGIYLQFNTTITVRLTLGPPFDSSTTPAAAAAAAAALPGHVISIQSVREAERDKPDETHGLFSGCDTVIIPCLFDIYGMCSNATFSVFRVMFTSSVMSRMSWDKTSKRCGK